MNETRVWSLQDVEIRRDGDKIGFNGYAAVFNALSEDLGGFREQVSPGAFKRTIRNSDIRLLINHDPNLVLARNKAGTLSLREDEVGLRVEADLAPTSYARDLVTLVERGDVNQMSFAFRTIKDDWSTVDGGQLRTLKEVRLFDTSVVTYPAYPQTQADVARDTGRALALAGIEARDYFAAINELAEGSPSAETIALIRNAIDALRTHLPQQEIDPEPPDPDPSQGTPPDDNGHASTLSVAFAERLLALTDA